MFIRYNILALQLNRELSCRFKKWLAVWDILFHVGTDNSDLKY